MDIVAQGDSYKCSVTRMHLLDLWISGDGCPADKERHVFGVLTDSFPDAENIDTNELQKRVVYVCKRFVVYWKECFRSKTKLVAKYSDWLNVTEECHLSGAVKRPRLAELQEGREPVPSTSGRPKKDFEDCSKRSQRRRIQKLSETDDSAVSAILNNSDRSNTSFSEANTDEVLSLIVEAKLNKDQYLKIRSFINSRPLTTLPSYQKVLEAKKRCYPSEEIITESSAEIDLQSLLDHTANRILESQQEVLNNISPAVLDNENLVLVGKWGFDGSTGHSEYKQSFSDSNIEDSSLFVTSYVPLQLICKTNTSDPDIIIWKNPRPSSTRYCRPIRFQFAKETKDLSVQEECHFQNKIINLKPTKFKFNDREITVQHSLQLTMVDGKVCSALTDIASSRCFICNATPKEMNNIDNILKKPVETANFRFGLSPLHAWIRFFEYFIHLAYRLDFQKYQVRSNEDKALCAQKKTNIQIQFREKLGLIIDKPRSGGSGSSNDGNTARKFFMNSSISAEITGIDKNLIEKCCTILQCLSSGYSINKDKFKDYALETARLLVQEYPWYYLPSSVHKVLIHGSEVIEHAMLSIGELSEEAAESSNKNIKLFRRSNTRKMSRIVTNTDLLHRLLLNSDPFISGLRKLPQKKKSLLSKEVFELLNMLQNVYCY